MANQSTLHFSPVNPGPGPAEPQAEWFEAVGPLLLLMAAFLGVIVFLPPEGRVSVPLHETCTALLGQAAFVLPLALAFVGSILVVQSIRPDVHLPFRRLTGVVVLLVAVLASEQLLAGGAGGTGLVGEWLSTLFVDLLGGSITVLVLLVALATGTLLAFNVRLILPRKVPRPQNEPHAEG